MANAGSPGGAKARLSGEHTMRRENVATSISGSVAKSCCTRGHSHPGDGGHMSCHIGASLGTSARCR